MSDRGLTFDDIKVFAYKTKFDVEYGKWITFEYSENTYRTVIDRSDFKCDTKEQLIKECEEYLEKYYT